MKKTALLMVLLLGAGFTTVSAQKTPPQAVVAAFNQKFPGTQDVDWDMEKNGEWEAEFEQDGTDMSANFSTAGQWLETETEIQPAELPAAVQTALQGTIVKEAARIQKADGSTLYEAEVGRKDLLFDASGKRVN